jgi:hypothetical protein
MKDSDSELYQDFLFLIGEIPLQSTIPQNDECVCSSRALLDFGCKCGAFKVKK